MRSKQKVLPEKKIALLIIDYHQELLKRGSERGCDPGAPLTYFNDGGSDRGSYFVPKKIPTFFSIPKKIPQCFCISKFYYLCSGKLKHANFNFGFGQKQNYTKTNTKSSHDFYSRLQSQKYPVIPHKK